MPTATNAFLDTLRSHLLGRDLVWFGVRATDARPLLKHFVLGYCFSIVAPIGGEDILEFSLENLLSRRVDHNRYNIDDPESEGSMLFWQQSEEIVQQLAVRGSVALVSYRPWGFLMPIYFPRQNSIKYMGMFHEQQRGLEHKAWVETQLSRHGIRTIPWRYVSDHEPEVLKKWCAEGQGKFVLRTNRSDGGVGLAVVEGTPDVRGVSLGHDDGFLALSPLLRPSLPLNVNACVNSAGDVTIHAASVQLIGISECTDIPFGFCGNDFVAIKGVAPKTLNDLADVTRRTGIWLKQNGYLGAFGIDLLLYKGNLILTEVNPRFQCSSPLSAEIDESLGLPDIYADHMAAFLQVESRVKRLPLVELVREQPSLAQVICYNQKRSVFRKAGSCESRLPHTSLECLPMPGTEVAHGAMMFKLITQHSVTRDGLSLIPDVAAEIVTMSKCFAELR